MTDFLSTSDVAKRLKVSRATVWRWAREHQIASFGAGRTLRFAADEVERFIALHTRPAASLSPEERRPTTFRAQPTLPVDLQTWLANERARDREEHPRTRRGPARRPSTTGTKKTALATN